MQIPDGIQGNYYILVFTDSNLIGSATSPGLYFEANVDKVQARVGEYRGEGNNITAAPLPIILTNPPDLQVLVGVRDRARPDSAGPRPDRPGLHGDLHRHGRRRRRHARPAVAVG